MASPYDMPQSAAESSPFDKMSLDELKLELGELEADESELITSKKDARNDGDEDAFQKHDKELSEIMSYIDKVNVLINERSSEESFEADVEGRADSFEGRAESEERTTELDEISSLDRVSSLESEVEALNLKIKVVERQRSIVGDKKYSAYKASAAEPKPGTAEELEAHRRRLEHMRTTLEVSDDAFERQIDVLYDQRDEKLAELDSLSNQDLAA